MTKKVRIENGDTSDHKLNVFVENNVGGTWVRDPSVLPGTLNYPTAMAEITVWKERRIVIEEAA